MLVRISVICLLALAVHSIASAEEGARYAPGKVIYDLSRSDPAALKNTLDRAGALQNIYGNNPFDASIVIVVHEGAIALFSKRNPASHELMQRAKSLAMGEVIEFRLCDMSARMQGFASGDFPEFITSVPMADAEIARLQQAGYAYLK